jgi:hypothetical protein
MKAMRILALGDIVGRPGRAAVHELLPAVVKQHSIDLVIANGENIAGGSGITANLFRKLRSYGVGCVTLGDHAFRKGDILPILDSSERIVRPANLSRRAAGRTHVIVPVQVGGREVPVAVFIVLGRLFIANMPADNPFAAADRILAELGQGVKVVVAELHCEATSEKQALGWHLAGRVSLAFGSHTHIPTADAKLIRGGGGTTAYITDVGMCGPYDSVLGRRKEAVVPWMADSIPAPFDVATGDVRLCGVIADVDENTGRATAVERFEVAAGNADQAYDRDDRAVSGPEE